MFVFGTCCPHGCMGRPCDSREGPPQRLGRAGEGGSPHQAFPVSPPGSGVQKWVGWGGGPRPGRGPGALVSQPAAHCWFCPSWGRGAGDARIWTWDKPVRAAPWVVCYPRAAECPGGSPSWFSEPPRVTLPSRKTSMTPGLPWAQQAAEGVRALGVAALASAACGTLPADTCAHDRGT